MSFSSDTLSKLREVLNLQPGNPFVFGFGIILCHLGDNGRYIEIYDNEEKLKAKLQISDYDDEYELGYDLFDILF
jgi:hypothetical protein